jgi:hypothetical protein
LTDVDECGTFRDNALWDELLKTLNYPLKRSLLDAALRSRSVYRTVYSVRYLGRRNGNTVPDAFFDREQDGNFGSGKVLITVWAVEANERKADEDSLG